jgi:signal transduction histidine kinase
MTSPSHSLSERVDAAQAAIRSDPLKARQLVAEILAAAGPTEGKVRAAALMVRAILCHRDSDHAGTMGACREALELAKALQDYTVGARSLNLLGLCHHALADDRTALELFREADQMAEQAGDDTVRTMAQGNVAMVMHAQGDLESAREVYRQLIDNPKVQANSLLFAQMRHNLAQTSWDLGRDLPECAELFTLAAEGKRALGDRWSLTLTLCSLSGVWRDLGDFAKAREVLAEIATFLANEPSPELNNLYRLNLGVWLAAEKNPERDLLAAQQELEQALAAARAGKLTEYEVRTLEYLTKARIAAGRHAEACTELELMAALRQKYQSEESRRRIDRLRVVFDADRAQTDANHERRLREEAEAFNARIQDQNRRLEHLNREKSDIIGLIAHDLRAPLAAAVELTDDLVARAEDPIYVALSGRALLTTQRQMLDLTQSLLDVESLESGSMKPKTEQLDLRTLFTELQEARAAEIKTKQLNIRVTLPAEGLTWKGPALLCERAMENLFSNAIKYSPPDRPILLAAGVKELNTLEVSVSDQGPGIPPDKRKNMFGKFVTLGTLPTGGESAHGLGLYLAQSCAQHAGGHIRYEDTPGGGATFVLALPNNHQ